LRCGTYWMTAFGLIKFWLKVSEPEQKRRFAACIRSAQMCARRDRLWLTWSPAKPTLRIRRAQHRAQSPIVHLGVMALIQGNGCHRG
jgi:hypothetical protein